MTARSGWPFGQPCEKGHSEHKDTTTYTGAVEVAAEAERWVYPGRRSWGTIPDRNSRVADRLATVLQRRKRGHDCGSARTVRGA